MKTLSRPDEIRRESLRAKAEGLRVGFVPTMGALHEGHISLVRRSRAECGFTVASIFVNPTQFGAGEDFERYPRNLSADSTLLAEEGVDLLFAPSPAEIYPTGFATQVEVPGLTAGLCSPLRPGHFRGVATVVAKLFNIVRPDAAYFGQKDAQQAAVIRRMGEDLDFGIDVVVCPTVREPDGLAMSSRNAYLTAEERSIAPMLYAALQAVRQAADAGERSAAALVALAESRLAATPFRVEYIEIVRADDLRPVALLEGENLVAVAGRLGATRLIDNIFLSVSSDRFPADRSTVKG